MDVMLLLKATVLLSATLLVARLLHRAPAAGRHRLWTVAFAAVLALPVLAAALPALYVPVPTFAKATVDKPASADATETPAFAKAPAGKPASAEATVGRNPDDSPASSMATREAPSLSSPGFVVPSVRTLLLTVWVAGTLAAAAALFVSLVRVRRLAAASQDMGEATWIEAAHALGARLGLRRPARLLVSPSVATPMAGGVWRPAIFLPASARGWSTEQRDVVLAHELAHLAGQDPLRHIAARLAVAFYWFHPLAWVAARRATAAREQACDEAVVALGTRPSDYARVLVELAESMRPSAAPLAALPMVERSHLETRVMAILKTDRRAASRRGLAIPAAGLALVALVLAAVQPGVQASPASVAIVSPPALAPAQPVASAVAAVPPAVPVQTGGDSACTSEWRRAANFSGRTDSRIIDGRTVIMEQVGVSGSDRIIQESFGDLRVCMVVEGAGPAAGDEKPSAWVGRARRTVLEARRGNRTQRLEVGPYGTGQRIAWQVDGKDRSFDAAAEQWRDRMLSALDTTWEMTRLRGEVSNLHGEISNIRGEESNLRGEISNLYGEESNLRGEISNVRGQESNLRGEISNIRGHVSNLQGAISSEQGSMSGLRAGGYRLDDSAAVRDALKRHENEIAKIEREIRDYGADAKVAAVEREIARLNANKQVDALEAQIRTFDLNRKVADVERQIAALDINGKIAGLQKKIERADAERRVRELEKRREDELKRLEAALAAIR